MHYGPCENGELSRFVAILFVILVVHKYVKSNGDE